VSEEAVAPSARTMRVTAVAAQRRGGACSSLTHSEFADSDKSRSPCPSFYVQHLSTQTQRSAGQAQRRTAHSFALHPGCNERIACIGCATCPKLLRSTVAAKKIPQCCSSGPALQVTDNAAVRVLEVACRLDSELPWRCVSDVGVVVGCPGLQSAACCLYGWKDV
jgi:hypothetical protein